MIFDTLTYSILAISVLLTLAIIVCIKKENKIKNR